MKLTLATAPDSWGVWFANDARQTPWHRCLDEIAAAGYRWTELGPYGYAPTGIDALRRELAARKLRVCSAFVMHDLADPKGWAILEKQVLGVGDLLGTLGAAHLVLIDGTYSDLFTGQMIGPPRLDEPGWKRLVENTHRVARLAKEKFGLKTVFHPHAETHVEYEDQIERLLGDTDPALVYLCLDTGHHAYRGGDPVAFLRRHHRRTPYLHLKSVDLEKQRRVNAEKTPFALAVGADMFCEPSRGAVDFAAFRDALNEVGYEGFGVVEQDMFPCDFAKPLPIAKRTFAYLTGLGFGVPETSRA